MVALLPENFSTEICAFLIHLKMTLSVLVISYHIMAVDKVGDSNHHCLKLTQYCSKVLPPVHVGCRLVMLT